MAGLNIQPKSHFFNQQFASTQQKYQPTFGLQKKQMNSNANDPLHGLTLETILTRLVEKHGWKELSQRIPIRCFYNEPSIKSSLKFLRRTPWARKQVEELYLETFA
jgi:uncharacterized protein (DUF2132 family)